MSGVPGDHPTAPLAGAARPWWDAWPVTVGLVVLALVPLVASAVAVAPGWLPVGDDATIVMRGRDLLTGETPLLGMPSAVGEQTGRPVHHPGPLELWWVGAWVRALGTPVAAVAASAVAWGASLVATLLLARRIGGPALLALAAVVASLLTWSLRGEVPVTPFNVHAIVVPIAGTIVALVAWHQRVRWAGLAAIVLGSWAAQAHLTAVGPVAAATTVAVGAVGLRRLRTVPRHRIDPRPVVLGVAVLAACWIGPALDAVADDGGNVRAVLDARSDLASEAIGLGTATDVVVRALAVRPVWASAGAHPSRLVVPAEAGHWATAGLVVALGLAGAVAFRRSHPALGVAVVATLAALVTGAVLAARFPNDYLSLLALHNHLWLWPVTAVLWACALAAVGLALRAALGGRSSPRAARLRPVLVGAAVAALVVVGIASVGEPHRNLTLAEPDYVRTLADGALARLDPDETYRVAISGEFDAFFVEVGLLAELERAGLDVVGPERYRRAFGDRRVSPRRPVAGELAVRIGWEAASGAPGRRLAAHRPSAALLAERAAVEDELVALVRRHPDDLPLWGMQGTGDTELRRWLREDLDGYLLARLVPGWMAAAEETDRYLDLRRRPVLHASVHLVPAGEGDR